MTINLEELTSLMEEYASTLQDYMKDDWYVTDRGAFEGCMHNFLQWAVEQQGQKEDPYEFLDRGCCRGRNDDGLIEVDRIEQENENGSIATILEFDDDHIIHRWRQNWYGSIYKHKETGEIYFNGD